MAPHQKYTALYYTDGVGTALDDAALTFFAAAAVPGELRLRLSASRSTKKPRTPAMASLCTPRFSKAGT